MDGNTTQDDATREFVGEVLDSFASGAIILDANGTIINANAAAAHILNIDAEALENGTLWKNNPQLHIFTDLIEEVNKLGRAVSRREIEIPKTRGVIGVTISPLKRERGGHVLLFTDLTQIRELERRAKLNSQLAQIGELTAGVVHEVRNPLSVISGMSELLMRRLDEDSPQHNQANLIFQEAAQLEKLIAQFLSFAKPFEVEMQRTNPHEIAQRALRLSERAADKKNVQLIWDQNQESFPYIPCDSRKLSQALSNIIHNGIEVVDEGGRITLNLEDIGDFFCFTIHLRLCVGPSDILCGKGLIHHTT